MIRRRTAAIRDVQRSHLVLSLHDHPDRSPDEAAELVGLSARQVQRWRRRWVAGDFSIVDETGRGRKPAFSPAGQRPSASYGL
jgi:Homeodomain-like domain